MFSYGVVLWEIVTLMIPWRHDDKNLGGTNGPAVATARGGGGGDQHFRDPTLYVINCVPKGDRLDLPAAQEIEPLLPELPKVWTPLLFTVEHYLIGILQESHWGNTVLLGKCRSRVGCGTRREAYRVDLLPIYALVPVNTCHQTVSKSYRCQCCSLLEAVGAKAMRTFAC